MRQYTLAAAACVIVSAVAPLAPARAGDLFTVTVTSNGETNTAGFNTAVQVVDQFKQGELTQLVPGYTSTSIATGVVNYRGLTVNAGFLSNSTTLTFQVPSAGINQTFTGATRDDSATDLLDWLKTGGHYDDIMHELVAVSPSDPVAGNPNSLQSRMVADSFSSAFATAPSATAPAGPAPNSVAVGLEYGHFTGTNANADAITLPLGYAFNVGPDDRYRLSIDLPLTYVNTQGAQTGAASLGIGLTVPITDNWSLTPRISAGATGSVDLGAVAALAAGSVTSAYKFLFDGYGFVIGDMLGYSSSLNLQFGQYSFNPNIENGFTKNGVMLAIPTSKFGFQIPHLPDSDMQVFVTDTRFWGSKLYENNYQEIGFSVGSSQLEVLGNDLRLGVSYIHAPKSNGITANFGFTF